MLRDHSFRRANISVGFAFLAMLACLVGFGGDASESESQLSAAIIFGTMLITLLAQYEIKAWREQRSDRGCEDDQVG